MITKHLTFISSQQFQNQSFRVDKKSNKNISKFPKIGAGGDKKHIDFFVSPELSSVRDYVITHSVRSMYVVRSMCMYVVICEIDHCIHIH